MKRIATATWAGTGLEGNGSLSTPMSGALTSLPFDFKARFVSEDGTAGTNPEELIAAAHASCFSMALSFQLAGAGFPADSISTKAVLNMEKQDIGWAVTAVHLDVAVAAAGLDAGKLEELAGNAKKGCPISRLLNCEITMDAKLA